MSNEKNKGMYRDFLVSKKIIEENVNINNFSGWALYRSYGNWNINFDVSKTITYKNSIKDMYDAYIFYVDKGKIVHMTNIHVILNKKDNEKDDNVFYVFTDAYTVEQYRKNGFFSTAREKVENDDLIKVIK